MNRNSEGSKENTKASDLAEFDGRHLLVGTTPQMVALTRIRAVLLKSARDFFDKDGWLEIGPIPAISTLTGACEDLSTLFSVDYFGRKAFLIQTGQQHLEPFTRGPIARVYAINQSYRADRLAPERRLTSFLLIEAEAAYYDLAKIQETLERLLFNLCRDVVLWNKKDLYEIGADTERLINIKMPLPRVTYTEAIMRLKMMGFPISWGDDLKGEHEKALGERFGQPFFVTHYPGSIKFFNMKDDPEDPRVVLSCDLLVPGYGEVVGASEREDSYDRLKQKLDLFARDETRMRNMQDLGMSNPEDMEKAYEWYLDLRKVGGVPHAGFGLGFERLVQWICDLPSIMQSTEYPKNKEYLAP